MSRGISISGDVAAGQIYVPRAQHLLDRLESRAKTSNLNVLREYERLDDNAYCYAMLAAGASRAVIVVDSGSEGEPIVQRQVYIPDVPDFYSGTIIGGLLVQSGEVETLDKFRATEACAKLFELEAGTDLFSTRKLAVEPYSPYAEVLGSKNERLKFSQYVELKPTMYSGTMRKVVQLLMGFGRQLGKKSIYDKTPPRPIIEGKKSSATKYQRDVAANGLQIRFDWRWFRTHGIVRAADDKLWLVEIGQVRGILAMLLPMNAISKTPEFREKLEALDDTAGILALDELGGFPTGEAFPAGDMEAWIRAGRVIRMADASDLQPFYENTPYSSSMGWAFNSSGSEAHNTCYRYEEDLVQTGLHYSVSLSVGSSEELPEQAGAKALHARIAKLEEVRAYATRFAAVDYKIDRMTAEQISQIQTIGQSRETLFEALDALELAPPATASGNLSIVGQGRLFYASKLQPHLKFPEPDLGYLLTHDMRSEGPPDFEVRCDTTVMVFFADDVLKWVKFFTDARKSEPIVESDFEECMYVGEWTSKTQNGLNSIPPMVYTNDYDDRERLPAGESTTKIKSVDLGYVSIIFGDDPVRPYESSLIRTRAFRRATDTTITGGEFIASSVTVPFHDRCAYYYTHAKGADSKQTVYVDSYLTLGDPYSCTSWRNLLGFTGFTPMGCGESPPPHACWTRAAHPDGCGPVEYRAVYAPGAEYNPYPCSDFADRGPWCFTCDNAEELAYTLTLPELTQRPGTLEISKVKRTTVLLNESDQTPLVVDVADTTALGYVNPWFIPSPNPETGSTQYLDVTHNAFGDGTTLRYWQQPNTGPIIVKGSPYLSDMETKATTFVGVV